MAPTSIEVKVISCKDLKLFNFFQKLATYATVSIASLDPNNHETVKKRFQQQKTPVDRDGDGNPEWNHHTKFDLTQIEIELLQSDHLFIQFDLYNEGGLFGDRSIGHVRVPIKELINEGTGAVRFACYQVMTGDGKPNHGVLDFSYKVIGAEIVNDYPPPALPSLYPSVESISSMYPPPPPPEVFYPTQEVYYASPPQTPQYYASPPQTPYFPSQEVYYPPLPPPPPPPPVVYPMPVPPTSYPPAHSVHEYQFPSVDPYQRPHDDGTWRRDEHAGGPWNVR